MPAVKGGFHLETDFVEKFLVPETLSMTTLRRMSLLGEGRDAPRLHGPPLSQSAEATSPNNRRRAGVRTADITAAGSAGEVAGFVVRLRHASRDAFQVGGGQVGEGFTVEGELERLLHHQGLLSGIGAARAAVFTRTVGILQRSFKKKVPARTGLGTGPELGARPPR
jgi:hypothetical protein